MHCILFNMLARLMNRKIRKHNSSNKLLLNKFRDINLEKLKEKLIMWYLGYFHFKQTNIEIRVCQHIVFFQKGFIDNLTLKHYTDLQRKLLSVNILLNCRSHVNEGLSKTISIVHRRLMGKCVWNSRHSYRIQLVREDITFVDKNNGMNQTEYENRDLHGVLYRCLNPPYDNISVLLCPESYI